MPQGRGKRLRLRCSFSSVQLRVQPNQSKSLLFSCLGAFCPGKHAAWKRALWEQAFLDCRPLTQQQRAAYLDAALAAESVPPCTTPLFKLLSLPSTARRRQQRRAVLQQLERRMSYAEMVLLRRAAQRWPALPEPAALCIAGAAVPADEELLEGQAHVSAELLQFAQRLQALKLAAWELGSCLREIWLEQCTVQRLTVLLHARGRPAVTATAAGAAAAGTTTAGDAATTAAEQGLGPDAHAFDGALQATAHAAVFEASGRMFLARSAASGRAYSRSASGLEGEPELPWLQCAVSATQPVLIDEATAARCGYAQTSACLIDPATLLTDSDSSTLPLVSATAALRSDYSLHVSTLVRGVRTTVAVPALRDVAVILIDAFRRRWSAGGEYPVVQQPIMLSRVQCDTAAATTDTAGSSAKQPVTHRSSSTARLSRQRSSKGSLLSCDIGISRRDSFREALQELDSVDIVAGTLRSMQAESARAVAAPASVATAAAVAAATESAADNASRNAAALRSEQAAEQQLAECMQLGGSSDHSSSAVITELNGATSAASATAAAAAAVTTDTATAAPAPWQHLLLRGRKLTVDCIFEQTDLLLLQDPRTEAGAGGGNCVALRSTGSFHLHSAKCAEQLCLQLSSTALLPCALVQSRGTELRATAATAAHAEHGVLTVPLPLLERCWLGRGLIAVQARPLLELLTLSISFSTTVTTTTAGDTAGAATTGASAAVVEAKLADVTTTEAQPDLDDDSEQQSTVATARGSPEQQASDDGLPDTTDSTEDTAAVLDAAATATDDAHVTVESAEDTVTTQVRCLNYYIIEVTHCFPRH
jgi:hypothetical protein